MAESGSTALRWALWQQAGRQKSERSTDILLYVEIRVCHTHVVADSLWLPDLTCRLRFPCWLLPRMCLNSKKNQIRAGISGLSVMSHSVSFVDVGFVSVSLPAAFLLCIFGCILLFLPLFFPFYLICLHFFTLLSHTIRCCSHQSFLSVSTLPFLIQALPLSVNKPPGVTL